MQLQDAIKAKICIDRLTANYLETFHKFLPALV